jgi:hypothetical protein
LQKKHPKVRHEVLGHAVIGVVQENFQWFTSSSPRQVAPNDDSASVAGSGGQVSDRTILAPGGARVSPGVSRENSVALC